ncbi:MAG: hypothetical protein QM809_02930 [Gordonia sp. (in: high G+C Gram-positive bacteria)]|uniref:hypothetical protein n=1 Tax=Gordonia sp. (in: high G+C Gram-positive bacteria) TaxID=84139 RepID=UPI0039E5D13E
MYDSLDDLAEAALAAATLSDADHWVAQNALGAGEPAFALVDIVYGTSKALPADLVSEIRAEFDDGLFEDLPSIEKSVSTALDSMQPQPST